MSREEQSVNNSSPPKIVTGEIIISSLTKPFRNATVHIRLEDISYADSRASLIAEKTLPDISHTGGAQDTAVSFTIELTSEQAAKIQPENDYTVRAWVDVDNDGERDADDLYSTEQYSILTRGSGSHVTIHVASRQREN